MNRNHFALSGLLLGLLLPIGVSAQTNAEGAFKEIRQMDWQPGPAEIPIKGINARYRLSEHEALLTGEQARRVMELGEGVKTPDLNALIVNGFGQQQIKSETMLFHVDVGYVTDEDWESLGSDQILKAVKESTAKENRQREKNGFPTLSVEGWRIPPRYDRASRTAYWALDVSSSRGLEVVNAVALKLSREGFTRMTWVGSPEQFHGDQTLAGIGEDLRFERGYRYADYSEGDAMAGVGLAALVTGIATGQGWKKAAATGLVATLIAFAKKLWWLALLPFIWLGSKLFGRGEGKT